MTTFQQFRVWYRRASGQQRVLTGIAGLIALSLVAWLVIPEDSDAQSTVTGGVEFGQVASGVPQPSLHDGAGAGAGGAGATGEAVQEAPGDIRGGGDVTAAPASGSDAAPAPPPSGGATAQPAAQHCPPGTDKGATEKEIRVAITIINIAGAVGNETIGVPTVERQEQYWKIVINSLNASGGFGCRKLIPGFYRVNPVNAADAQQKCLQIANSDTFLAIDTGTLTAIGSSDCIPNQKVPMVAHFLTTAQLKQYYPYYISLRGVLDDVTRNGVLAMKQQGYFGAGKGFKKLGVLFRSCRPDPIRSTREALKEVGVPDVSVVAYDLGCPPGKRNSPADFQQAVLTFKKGGVTHITEADVSDFANFTQAAGQQNYKPQYLLANDAVVGVTEPDNPQQPDAGNLDGALNFGALRYGERLTPGFQPTGGTAKCNAIFAAKGEPPVYEQQVGYGGVICSLMWFVQALLDKAPVMKRDALVQGMQSIGTVDFSYPEGPVDYAAVPKGTPYGLPFWRTTRFVGSCKCFRIAEPTFRPSFGR